MSSVDSQFGLQTHVELGTYNTMATPALAREFVKVTSIHQLKQALAYASQRNLDCFVLGEGSNTVFVCDYDGLIIRNELKGIELVEETQSHVVLKVASGENWHALVEYCVAKGWHGLENLALIPGTVGAAPIQNIGAYGVEVKDRIEYVEVLNHENSVVERIANQDCGFAYRESRFKSDWKGTKTVTAVVFKLSKETQAVVSYPALRAFVGTNPSIQDVFTAVVQIRTEKLPNPKELPNSGSFFKNPLVTPAQLTRLQQSYPGIVAFEHGDNYKLAAAWLIEQAGWKKRQHNGVKVHDKQALVITNPKHRSGRYVIDLAASIQKDVAMKYGVSLEIEPCVLI